MRGDAVVTCVRLKKGLARWTDEVHEETEGMPGWADGLVEG